MGYSAPKTNGWAHYDATSAKIASHDRAPLSRSPAKSSMTKVQNSKISSEVIGESRPTGFPTSFAHSETVSVQEREHRLSDEDWGHHVSRALSRDEHAQIAITTTETSTSGWWHMHKDNAIASPC